MATLVGEVGGDDHLRHTWWGGDIWRYKGDVWRYKGDDHLRHTWWGEIKGDVWRYNIGRGASGG